MRDVFIIAGRQALGFGDHHDCPQCGAPWVRPSDAARGVIADAATRYASLLAAGEQRAREPGVWSPSAYTVHTGDWLRIWAERLVTVADNPSTPLPSIDQDELARVRRYDEMAQAAAMHVLSSGAEDLLGTYERVGALEFTHPDFGVADSEAVLSWLAHEVDHHAWDVARLRGLM